MNCICRRAAVFVTTCLWLAIASIASAGEFQDLTFSSGNLGSIKYRVYVPDSYKADGPAIPVILYLHSAAERGDTVEAIFGFKTPQQTWKNNWIQSVIDETQKGSHQAILVMPESGMGQVWNSMTAGDNWGVGDYNNAKQKPITKQLQLAVLALKDVIGKNNIDKDRVYVTGPSMGGFGTWDALARYPELFAAGMPLSGGGNSEIFAGKLATKPIWMFHGADDGLIHAINTDTLYFAMKRGGGNPIYSRILKEGHGGWDLFYKPKTYTVDSPNKAGGKGMDVYDWLFSQRLSANPAPSTRPVATANKAPVIIGFGPGAYGTDLVDFTPEGTLIMYNFVESKDIRNCHDINGAPTTISITREGGIGGGSTHLEPTAPLTQWLPLHAFQFQLFTTEANGYTITFSGLKQDKTYTFEVLGSNMAEAGKEYATEYVLTGKEKQTKTLNTANNTKDTAVFESVTPIKGIVTLHVGNPAGGKSKDAYLNAVRITPVD